jgi:hypothetical protein
MRLWKFAKEFYPFHVGVIFFSANSIQVSNILMMSITITQIITKDKDLSIAYNRRVVKAKRNTSRRTKLKPPSVGLKENKLMDMQIGSMFKSVN